MRVLVVEDEPDLRRVVAASLREDGYAVDTAADGEEGVFKANAWEYDAVVLDVMLPKLDGWSVLEQIRATKRTPVLMLTARDTVADRVRGLNIGADDYLVKPFALTELLARLRALIRRSAGQTVSLIKIGEVHIDTVGKTVTRDSKLVGLTPMEYALVEMLALHRQKLVSRTAIYDHLFDEDDDSLSNLVDVHVSNIRKKLGRDFITTRRGQGYMIEG
ncbi:MAG: two-component system OmpR family response regulator [Planctomycetota bacterium]|nr:MAG: two-component system OmpR family response regulator [Planctomycetota bacterium]